MAGLAVSVDLRTAGLDDLPATMSAAVIDGVGADAVFRAADLSLPEPVVSEILVKVRAASANPIDDVTLLGGGVSRSIPSFPHVLGADFSGIVVRTPYSAHPLKVGDQVYGVLSVPRSPGSFAGYAAVPSLQVAKAPSRLTLLEAAAVPMAALTAWGMVVEVGKTHEGQRVLVRGAASGVGHVAVQLAHYFGAYVVAAAEKDETAWVRDLGADRVIELAALGPGLVPGGFDVLIDAGGSIGERTPGELVAALRPGGLLVTSGEEAWPAMTAACESAGVRFTGYRPVPDGATLAVIARLIDSGDLSVHVDQVYPLSRVDEALCRLREGHVRGKIVVEVGDALG